MALSSLSLQRKLRWTSVVSVRYFLGEYSNAIQNQPKDVRGIALKHRQSILYRLRYYECGLSSGDLTRISRTRVTEVSFESM